MAALQAMEKSSASQMFSRLLGSSLRLDRARDNCRQELHDQQGPSGGHSHALPGLTARLRLHYRGGQWVSTVAKSYNNSNNS